ncbi:MAG TPA: hypothetical protein VLW85_02835 [Myxococcales bacterium]|nr:hypothetical protein [Myxococcales bacterium]
MSDELLKKPPEPPVVARLVVEIRSDGTRTIARGMAEDVERGERVQVQAEGATPLQLILSLVRSLKDLPALAKLLLPGRK